MKSIALQETPDSIRHTNIWTESEVSELIVINEKTDNIYLINVRSMYENCLQMGHRKK